MADDKQFEKMVNTPVEKLIPSLAVPMIISMLVTAIYNFCITNKHKCIGGGRCCVFTYEHYAGFGISFRYGCGKQHIGTSWAEGL